VTYRTMCTDAAAAARVMGEVQGPVAVLGTRLGALVAAHLSGGLGRGPLVLWEPVLDPIRFFRDGYRARLMSGIVQGVDGGAPSLETLLDREGAVDAVGFELTRSLLDSCPALDPSALRRNASGVMLVQIGGRSLRPDFARFAEAAAPAPVTVSTIDEPERWWLADGRYEVGEHESLTARLVAETAGWVTERLTGGAA
jgi:hypothetical protein